MSRIRTMCLSAVAVLALAACSTEDKPDAARRRLRLCRPNPIRSSNPARCRSRRRSSTASRTATFEPAIEEGMKRQLAEIDAIADNPAPPTFDNTIVAMEKSGQMLDPGQNVFHALTPGQHRRHAAEGGGDRGAQARRPSRRHLSQRQAVRARRGDLRPARHAESRSRSADAGRSLLPRLRPCRRQAVGRRQGHAARHQQAALHAGDRVRQQAAGRPPRPARWWWTTRPSWRA